MTFTEDLFVTDRDRITCSGGTAPLYLMLDLMARRYGDAVAAGVSEQFILTVSAAPPKSSTSRWPRASASTDANW